MLFLNYERLSLNDSTVSNETESVYLSKASRLKPLKSYNIYHNLGYWFLLFIVLVITGFYQSYFKDFFEPKTRLVHAHFALMSIWILMLIAQPFLIKYKKLKWHRANGKLSYVVVPLVMLSSYLMMRTNYLAYADRLSEEVSRGTKSLKQAAIYQEAGSIFALPFFYFLVMGILYSLAIINKKRSNIHARYMMATSLTLLGPTVDRTIAFNFDISHFFGVIPIESFAFFLADLILIILLFRDWKHGRTVKPLLISLILFVTGQILYFTATNTSAWSWILQRILAIP